jgi:tRNA(Glu) U13 pseudouridine synthase TruD
MKGKDYLLRFMLQAYASMYFNEYALQRWEKGLHLLQGDIMVDRYYAEGANVGIYADGNVLLFDYRQLKETYDDVAMWEVLLKELNEEKKESEILSKTIHKWIPT